MSPAADNRPAAGRTHEVQKRFTAHIRDPLREPPPDGIEDRRMAIYRDLVYSNMESFLSSNFPVIRKLYNDDEWSVLAHDFFREHRCHTPLFPEFAREFLRYLEVRQQEQRGDPPFLLELAHYEWAELALSLEEAEISDVPHDPTGDPIVGVPIVSPLAWVLGYRFPVHRIGPAYRPAEPPAEPTWLLLARGRDDEVRFNEINALSATLIERLQQNSGLTGLQCLDALLAEHAAGNAAELREAGKSVLLELKTREAILGTVP